MPAATPARITGTTWMRGPRRSATRPGGRVPRRGSTAAIRRARADDPVGGVSWYEAAAYCAFRGEALPTVFHWARAALAPREITAPLGPAIVPLSNFGGKGPAPVGSHKGMGPYGTFDLAGNVREWTWNAASAGRRWILGGAWNDPSYMFSVPNSLPPDDRSPANGFRCMRTGEGVPAVPPASCSSTLEVSSPDYRGVAAGVGRNLRALCAAARLHPARPAPRTSCSARRRRPDRFANRCRSTRATTASVSRFRCSCRADRKGPYQAVVYFPALNAFQSRASSRTYLAADYVVKSGRALVLPVYKGSFERWDDALDATGEQYFRAARQRLLQWRQDLGRTIDYLDTPRRHPHGSRGVLRPQLRRVDAAAAARAGAAVPHRDLLQRRFHLPHAAAGDGCRQLRVAREDPGADALRAGTTTSFPTTRRSGRSSSCSARRPPRNGTSSSMPATIRCRAAR